MRHRTPVPALVRLPGVTVLVAALAAGLAACDDGSDGAGGAGAADGGGPGTSGLPRPEDAGKGEEVDLDAFLDELAASFDDGASARVRFDVTGQAKVRGRGVVRYAEEGMDVDLHLADWQVDGGTVDLRTVGGSTYMRVPESRGLWVVISAEELGLTDSVLADADPRTQLDDAAEEIGEVRYTGDDTLDGAAVRRYQVVAGSGSAAPGTAPVVTEYWFDSEGRVVRRTVDLGASGTASFTWAEWGEPVDITAPPAEETITVRRLERLRKQQQGGG